jgi:hypothetical protein
LIVSPVHHPDFAFQNDVALEENLARFPAEDPGFGKVANEHAVGGLAVQLHRHEILSLHDARLGSIFFPIRFDGKHERAQEIELFGIGEPPLASLGIALAKQNAEIDLQDFRDPPRHFEAGDALIRLDLADVCGRHHDFAGQRGLCEPAQVSVEANVFTESLQWQPSSSARREDRGKCDKA